MTLLETLVSLALLGALALGSAGVVAVTARGSTESAVRVWFEAGAAGVLDCICDDLLAGDFPSDGPRISTSDGTLAIRTRARTSSGEVASERRYRLNAAGELLMSERGGVQGRERPVLGGVALLECARPDPDGPLEVAIVGVQGASVRRRFHIP